MSKWPIVAALLVLLSACSFTADKSAAEAGVERFHRMLDAGQYAEIYREAAPEFRQTTTEQNAIALFRTVHERLGEVRNQTQQGWRVNFVGGGNVVNLGYQTQFAAGSAIESFIFRVNGGSVQLLGYNINSTELLIAPQAPAQGNMDEAEGGNEAATR